MAIGDVYQIKMTQTQSAQVINNVFYYIASAGFTSAQDLLDAFVADIFTPMIGMYSAACVTKQIQVVNGMANGDQVVEDMSVAGSRAGVSLATFLACGMRKRNAGIGSRYSYKRFLYGVVADLTGQGLWGAPFLADVAPIADALGAVLEGVEGAYNPVQITGGFQLGVEPTVSQFLSGSWQVNGKVTHQDTRQEFFWLTV